MLDSNVLISGIASAIDAQPDIFVTGDLDFHTDVVCKFINVVNTSLAFELIR